MNTPLYPTADDLLPTRRTLLERLVNLDDNKSWHDFFETYWKFIYGVARRSGLTEAEAQDVVQETIIYFSRKMPGFKYDAAKGSFKAWLTRLTKWRIADQFRKRDGNLVAFDPPGPGEPDPFEQLADPASFNPAVIDEEWDRNLVEAAIQKVKEQVKPKHFQVFDLCVSKQWPMKKVASALGVNIAQVYLVKCRIKTLLTKELEKLQARS